MEIGIISDTHNHLPEKAEKLLRGVEYILHAGDVGGYHIIEKLAAIAPVQAVCGNTDLYTVASVLSAQLRFTLDGIRVLMKHDIGHLRFFASRLQGVNKDERPDLVVFGHTHRPVYEKVYNTYFVNPGSVSKPRGGFPCSLVRMSLRNGKIIDHQLIEV
jgi:putative phosphoesterase